MSETGSRSRPALIVVSGVPGTGKTMLAAALGDRLGWPVVHKDQLKEALFDASDLEIEHLTLGLSNALGAQAMESIYAIGGALVRSGTSCIVEANFLPRFAQGPFSELTEIADVRQVHCAAPAAVTIARYRERFESGMRHPVHMDPVHAAARAIDPIPAADLEPIPLDAPLLRVDTENGYRPGLDEIVAFCGGDGRR